MIGLPSGVVALAEPNESFSAEYSAAFAGLHTKVKELAAVEHIGSTAVESLIAKPIIDIAIGIYDMVFLEDVIELLRLSDYRYRGFRRDAGGHIADYVCGLLTTRHIHILEYGSTQWHRYLLFRELLRASPAARDAYCRLKSFLATHFPTDRRSYTKWKKDFIESLTDLWMSESESNEPLVLRPPPDPVDIASLLRDFASRWSSQRPG